MKKIIYLICLIFPLLLNQSCLKMGLEEPPSSSGADVTNVYFEYRWEASGKMTVITLVKKIVESTKTAEGGNITVDITVPAVTSAFTAEIRNAVALNNIVGYCDISPGATIMPIGNSPILGSKGDFSSKQFQYKVAAANGTQKTWTIKIGNFVK